ncbi:bifunctional DNA primase/polymerase [Rhodococcus pyridinivorans]|uniref:bifunctional DNA primase/polymerase n=1 Tax=Rhodococcus pyridinivorans TaxID=103816 RepID=UPI00200ABD1A|nr:bifunctional DNA primase/polymerase [Rhodococcus pyridinivorans]UPW02914.1 bifunctional DNA primase/polymerase [Rhodococcus pyridinivorans]
MNMHGAVSSVLLRMNAAWPLSAAAPEFARAGVPVFPCAPWGKRPATEHGFHDATTNLDQVEAWWRQSPGANIGVPTGAASGTVVVDVDVHGPVDGHASFDRARRAGLVDGWELLVRTPTGGLHAYYPATPGTEQRSWQAARAGIDFRGDGGYIIVPPSARSIEGTTVAYQVEEVNAGPASLLDAGRLRDFLDPRPTPRPAPAGLDRGVDVTRLAAWVAGRGEGERNRGLFWAACRLAENGLPASDALDVLTAAAGHAGLAEREITATVRSAYRTVHPTPARRGAHDGSSPARGASPLAGDGWLDRNASTRPPAGSSRVRGL